MPPPFAAVTVPDAVSVPLFSTVPFRKKSWPLVQVAFVWFSKTRLSVTAPLVGDNANAAPDVSSVSPVPAIVPAFQLKAPSTVMFPLPVKVPAKIFNCVNVRAVLTVMVPPLTVKTGVLSVEAKLVVPALAMAPTCTAPPKLVVPLV